MTKNHLQGKDQNAALQNLTSEGGRSVGVRHKVLQLRLLPKLPRHRRERAQHDARLDREELRELLEHVGFAADEIAKFWGGGFQHIDKGHKDRLDVEEFCNVYKIVKQKVLFSMTGGGGGGTDPEALRQEHARACQDLEARLALARAKAREQLEKRLETQRLEKQRQSSRNNKDAVRGAELTES